MAAAGSWPRVPCDRSQKHGIVASAREENKTKKRSTMRTTKSIGFTRAQYKYSSECKKIPSERLQGRRQTHNTHTNTLKGRSTLIHCIHRRNNSPAAISQRRHSRPRHLLFCRRESTCHRLTLLIKPQVRSGANMHPPRPPPSWTP